MAVAGDGLRIGVASELWDLQWVQFLLATITSAISLYAQVQFHAKYPLIDSQSEREFAFSYAIPR